MKLFEGETPAVKRAPVGTPIFYVPIRYWETQEPETGHIVDHGDVGRETHDGDVTSIYAYHDGYGHNVYLRANRAFLTHDEAVAEANRLKAEKEEEDKRKIDAIMKRLFPTHD